MKLLMHQADFLNSNAKHTGLIGGYGCFLENQKIIKADDNLCEISKIKVNDKVKSYNEKTKEIENKKVVKIFKYNANEYFKIKLKDGIEINVTKNHKFFYENKWVKIKDILKLWNGKK